MSWRDRLTLAVGREPVLKPSPPNQTDRMDQMDRTSLAGDSVHTVHFVHTTSGPRKLSGMVPALAPSEAAEALAWPAPTQRLLLAAMDHFQRQGHRHLEAEALAYATVKTLMERHSWLFILQGQPGHVAPDLSAWPREAIAEVQEQSIRLHAGDWTPAQAQDLAHAITVNQRELALPEPEGQAPSEAARAGLLRALPAGELH